MCSLKQPAHDRRAEAFLSVERVGSVARHFFERARRRERFLLCVCLSLTDVMGWFSPQILSKPRCDVCSRLPWFALQLGSKAQKCRQVKKADCFSVVLLVCGHVAKEYTKKKNPKENDGCTMLQGCNCCGQFSNLWWLVLKHKINN